MTDMQTGEAPRPRKKKSAKPVGSNQHLQKLHGYIAQMDASINEIREFIQQVHSQQTPDSTIAKKSVRDLNRHFDNSVREMQFYQEALDAENRRKLSELYTLIGKELDIDAALKLARDGDTDKEAIMLALLPEGGSGS
tara:strand:+ start:31351 stop:31764 length:414 start_codon:yes stop_codon:yes gene_type:complete